MSSCLLVFSDYVKKCFLPCPVLDDIFGFEEVVELCEEAGDAAAAASSAASFSSFFMRANCWRSDIGVWFGTAAIVFVVDVTNVGDEPVLFWINLEQENIWHEFSILTISI